jgi:hypothetical protein
MAFRVLFGKRTAVFLLVAVAFGHAGKGQIKIGPLRYENETDGFSGLDISMQGDRYRWVIEERFFGFPSFDHVGMNFDMMSFAYHRDGGAHRLSLNPLIWISVVGIGTSWMPDTSNTPFYDYGGFATFLTLLISPQILTNWSLRADIVPREWGFLAGPRTDYVVDKGRIEARTELQTSMYWRIPWGIGFDVAYAYDVLDKNRRVYLRLSGMAMP